MQRTRQTYDRAWSLIEAWAAGGQAVFAPQTIGHAIEVVDAFDEMVEEHLAADQRTEIEAPLAPGEVWTGVTRPSPQALGIRERPTAPALEAADGGIG